ncbi:MAG TPA: hypothetical protein VK689_15795 [Armatimonadota bacterium]|nr:hypothetical protein [Armatimonadota bacterium]
MTRAEALSRARVYSGVPHSQSATGSDGARWFHKSRNTSRGDDWTFEILWDGRRFYEVEAETDPPGVDWDPGTFDPPADSLPVTDPAVEYARPAEQAAGDEAPASPGE